MTLSGFCLRSFRCNSCCFTLLSSFQLLFEGFSEAFVYMEATKASLLLRSGDQSVLIGWPSGQMSSNGHLIQHSYPNQPSNIVYQPVVFDLSSLYRTNHLAPVTPTSTASTSSATFTANAAGIAPQFAAYQIPAAQVDQQILEEYNKYLTILRNAYGIQLPGELGQTAPAQPDYQLSAYSTTKTASSEVVADPCTPGASELASKAVNKEINQLGSSYTTNTPTSLPQYHVFPQTLPIYISPQQQPLVHQQTVQVQQLPQTPSSSEVYSQATYSEPQEQNLVSQQQQYPPTYSITPVALPALHSHESVIQPSYTVQIQPQYSQLAAQYPGKQTVQYPVEQISSTIQQPQYSLHSQVQPQPSITAETTHPQSVYTYRGHAINSQSVIPTYSTDVIFTTGSHPQQMVGFQSNLLAVSTAETQGSIYAGETESMNNTIISSYATTPSYWLSSAATKTTSPQSTTSRPHPLPANAQTPSNTNKSQGTVISAQSLARQIRHLPAILYADSRNESSEKLETMLRDTYGLPLVASYVDKLDQPHLVEKLLYQLTAHKTLPYLFICGAFIGGEEHIQNYHKNGQISKLVEYVCGEGRETKKETERTKKTSA
uniref:Glutaredoxin domain-containing protein n=1 Tax=Angiostrongylus cantonensis TaxID=6313 RepID=A0A158P8J8_ANGCA